VGSLLPSLLIGVLVAGAVFVVADRLRGLMDARSVVFAGAPRPGSLVQTGSDNESPGRRAAWNPFEGRGIEIAAGISLLAFLSCLVWHYYPLYDRAVAVLTGSAAGLEERGAGFDDVGSAFGIGAPTSTPGSGSGRQYTDTTVSGGSSGTVNYTEREYLIPFRGYHGHQPAVRSAPAFGNGWGGGQHSSFASPRAIASSPTIVSHPMAASRPRR
jgi:hypothetical protein